MAMSKYISVSLDYEQCRKLFELFDVPRPNRDSGVFPRVPNPKWGFCRLHILLAPKTRLFRIGDNFEVKFYRRRILMFRPDGSYVLNRKAFQNVRTRARIKRFSPVSVFQRDKKWYVVANADQAQPFRFVDGMVLRHTRVDVLATLGVEDCPIDWSEPLIAADWLEEIGNRPEEANRIRKYVRRYLS